MSHESHPGPIPCPHCQRVLDEHTGATENGPRPGDISFCWRCKGLSVFGASGTGLELRTATAEERRGIKGHPQAQALLHAMMESTTPQEAVELFQATALAKRHRG